MILWFWPPIESIYPFCDISQAIMARNYLRTLWLVLLLLPVHFYDILVKLELYNGIIFIIIGDFVFWPPFSVNFVHFATFLRAYIHKIT